MFEFANCLSCVHALQLTSQVRAVGVISTQQHIYILLYNILFYIFICRHRYSAVYCTYNINHYFDRICIDDNLSNFFCEDRCFSMQQVQTHSASTERGSVESLCLVQDLSGQPPALASEWKIWIHNWQYATRHSHYIIYIYIYIMFMVHVSCSPSY